MPAKRVRVADYGTLRGDDPRLVPVPSISGRNCRLHWAAAAIVREIMRRWQADHPGKTPLLAASGWRPHRWRDRAHYEAALMRRYGSLAEGRKWIAYASPHETGLAVDFGSCGLEPRSATAEQQRALPVHRWLTAVAPPIGLVPYLVEPWHWEAPLSREAWEAHGPEAD